MLQKTENTTKEEIFEAIENIARRIANNPDNLTQLGREIFQKLEIHSKILVEHFDPAILGHTQNNFIIEIMSRTWAG